MSINGQAPAVAAAAVGTPKPPVSAAAAAPSAEAPRNMVAPSKPFAAVAAAPPSKPVAGATPALSKPVAPTSIPTSGGTPSSSSTEESAEMHAARLRREEALKKKEKMASMLSDEALKEEKPTPAVSVPPATRDYDPAALKSLAGSSAFAPQGLFKKSAGV